ncbi:hypothetical protein Q4574_16320 [Aliiglaciecola sp. 3_MG-2023]|uniref:hypothetical protein n=1 Tax=Aliiglaciecola sp. 3_MG-2023 TaxID=3062644 RepID=UPI0026E43424|nr:hypothetical protein [Aliiglaciecola sp. 3_MG-2023]MDO6694864.1 hypothetical protein [Aliiglaciecola sp. 3_MG-2023]
MRKPLFLSLSALSIFSIGYWLGTLQAENSGDQQQQAILSKEVHIEVDEGSIQPSLNELNSVHSKPTQSENVEIQIVNHESDSPENGNDPKQQAQHLAELGDAFQHSKLSRQQKLANEAEFEQNYSANDADLRSQNQISDFLMLHQQADLITLHRLDCDPTRCQMIGEYAGEHQNWSKVFSAMRDSDWWEYVGTSSTTTTQDGKTYFHIFLNK